MGDLDPGAEALNRFYAEFGRLVREARQAAGWSQSRLEREARVAPCTVSRVERCEAEDIAVVDLVRLAAALQVPLAELLPPLPGRDEPEDEPGRPRGIVQWD